jgi:hypothetical protein
MVDSTQQAIDIAGIKDGIMVMKDGSYRLVFQVSATNFALKSEQEQNSIIFQYQSFLNSLHFPIQIVIRSRQLDLTQYIAKIEKMSETQSNDLIKVQTLDYVDFLKKLIEMANIMKKIFYVVISYNPITIKKSGLFDKFFAKKSVFEHIKISEDEFKNYTNKLSERANIVAGGLGQMGLHCFQLSTEDLIELYYQIYNPDDATKERVKDITMLSSQVVMSEEEFDNKEEIKKQSQKEAGMIDNTAIVEEQRKRDAKQLQDDEAAQQTQTTTETNVKKEEPSAQQPAAEATTGSTDGATSTIPVNQDATTAEAGTNNNQTNQQ